LSQKNFPENIENPDAYAAVNLYTQEWDPAPESLYFHLNNLLRDQKMDNRTKSARLKPFHLYLNLVMSRLKQLPKVQGTVFRGVNVDLREVYRPNTCHTWWSFSSCTEIVSGMEDFLSKVGPRTLFEIKTEKGVNISGYSFYPAESEVLLLPGTCLKVVDQLDLGGGLVVIQLQQIPSMVEVTTSLLGDKEAIEFWLELSEEKFTTPLADFCESILRRHNLPLIKQLDKSTHYTSTHLEAYQKYWLLWIFGGGDLVTFNYYVNSSAGAENSSQNGITNLPPNYSDANVISVDKFGLLLSFGEYKGFLNNLWMAAANGYLYTDSMTSVIAGQRLQAFTKTGYSSVWMIRCTPRRDWPFTLSFCHDNDKPLHVRMQHSFSTHEYSVQLGKQRLSSQSMIALADTLQKLTLPPYIFGQPLHNTDFDSLFINPFNQSQQYLG